ncbi:MAG: threonine/serine exporter family protein [Streptococcaceae bacterium]|jgi:uncharacterized membrane protein YjjP (DUF1212 family)|nr:threonine/serine exporter family protein [Streptococcaceae bacterium]
MMNENFNMYQVDDEKKVLEACLLAGTIMMESSAEMYRIEDTMIRMGKKSGHQILCYTTQTGMFIAIDGTEKLRMASINKRILNLDKVTKVNQLSREYVNGEIDIDELLEKLKVVKHERIYFPLWLEVISAGVIGAGMMVVFGGVLSDFPATFILACLGYVAYLIFAKLLQLKFLAEFSASLFLGITAIMYARIFGTGEVNVMIFGLVMPYVPGVAITNSIRDLLAGHLISGLSRGVEALMTASAISFGIVFAFQLLH